MPKAQSEPRLAPDSFRSLSRNLLLIPKLGKSCHLVLVPDRPSLCTEGASRPSAQSLRNDWGGAVVVSVAFAPDAFGVGDVVFHGGFVEGVL
jgi:hypothetical protein